MSLKNGQTAHLMGTDVEPMFEVVIGADLQPMFKFGRAFLLNDMLKFKTQMATIETNARAGDRYLFYETHIAYRPFIPDKKGDRKNARS